MMFEALIIMGKGDIDNNEAYSIIIIMRSFLSSCASSYRGWVVGRRQAQMVRLYQKKDYQAIPRLFKDRRDYDQFTLDGYPFPYFLVTQDNQQALEAFFRGVAFGESLPLDDNNPLKTNLLMFAYLEDKEEVAAFLESQGFSLGVLNSEGQNLLHLATIYQRREAFMMGLRRKVNHDLEDLFGNTPLHYASRAGQVEFVEALLAGKARRVSNRDHLYPIHMAIESLSRPAVQMLRGDMWLKYPMFHPMHSAARVGSCEVMKQLVDSQPTLVNVVDHKRLTPLHHAVATENSEAQVFLLKQHGVLVNMTDTYGNTPLHIAFMRDDVDSAARLVEAGADPDIQNKDYLAPVDLGLDSSSQRTKGFVGSLAGRSKRLRSYSSDA